MHARRSATGRASRRYGAPPWGGLLVSGLALLAARGAASEVAVPSVVALQPDRSEQRLDLGAGGDAFRVRLVDLNPAFHVWHVFEVTPPDGPTRAYHLEFAGREGERLVLDPGGDLRVEGVDAPVDCGLEPLRAEGALEQARASGRGFAPLCAERLFLRNPIPGHRTQRERVTDFLRDNVWRGEQITVFVRSALYADAYHQAASPVRPPPPESGLGPLAATDGVPLPARLQPALADGFLDGSSLGIRAVGAPKGRLALGRWYAAEAQAGVFASAVRAGAVARDLPVGPRPLNALDEVESAALVYLVAFDLTRFEVGFALGTDHPRVGWSERVPPAVRDPALPGPDGFDTLHPLVPLGKVSPANAERTVATITGGFKRGHGAFKFGALANRNRGSHYGFAEQGVVLSRLQPGLSTFYVLDDGRVRLETWTEAHAALTTRLRFARQNGVALVERDPGTGEVVPGALVGQWGAGNWSGSQDARLRALRSGLCLQDSPGGRYLLYGYFSSATPLAMARVFQAYGCEYAMHLDMNALEHTYMALYRREGREVGVEHLIDEMKVLDLESEQGSAARFLGYVDNRDFFYLMRREEGRDS